MSSFGYSRGVICAEIISRPPQYVYGCKASAKLENDPNRTIYTGGIGIYWCSEGNSLVQLEPNLLCMLMAARSWSSLNVG